MKFCLFIIIPWGHVRSRTKFGPDRFGHFNVYWIQLQTDKHVWGSVCIKWLTVFDQYVNYILCIKGDISYLPVKLKKFQQSLSACHSGVPIGSLKTSQLILSNHFARNKLEYIYLFTCSKNQKTLE